MRRSGTYRVWVGLISVHYLFVSMALTNTCQLVFVSFLYYFSGESVAKIDLQTLTMINAIATTFTHVIHGFVF